MGGMDPKDLRGIIHADGYAGFNELVAAGT
jgi:hypothetical protein